MYIYSEGVQWTSLLDKSKVIQLKLLFHNQVYVYESKRRYYLTGNVKNCQSKRPNMKQTKLLFDISVAALRKLT